MICLKQVVCRVLELPGGRGYIGLPSASSAAGCL